MKRVLVVLCLLLASFSFSVVTAAEQPNVQEQVVEDGNSIMILEGTPLYDDAQLTKVVGNWKQASSIHTFERVGEVVTLTVAGKKVYVAKNAVQFSEQLPKKALTMIGYVRLEKAATIYTNEKAKTPFMELQVKAQTRLQVTGMKGDYFEVNVGGEKGYISKKLVTVNVNQPLKVLKNTAIKEGSKQVATLTADGVIKASKVVGTTYTVNTKFTFVSDSVVETTESAAWPADVKQTYEVTLTAQKAAGLYNANGKKFAEISAGSKVKLVNMTGEFGVIRTLGGTVFINLKEFKHNGLIAAEKSLSHAEMNYKLKLFAKLYPEFMQLETVGKSVEGREILALTVGTGKKQILMDASMHAREHMTTNVLMEMIDTYSYHYIHNSTMGGYNVRNVLDRVKITFVPMINPDGVTLVQGGKVLTPVATLRSLNGGSTNFKRWKSNIRGVDLNRNWDTNWKKLPVIKPKWEMAKGSKPFSEPETIALRDFVLKHPFKAYITYHSSGQIMYWEYGNGKGGKEKATALVRDLSKTTGYSIMKNSQSTITAASENWVSKKLDIPGVTMEIGTYAGHAPVALSQWNSVWKKNQTIGLLVANKAKGY